MMRVKIQYELRYVYNTIRYDYELRLRVTITAWDKSLRPPLEKGTFWKKAS